MKLTRKQQQLLEFVKLQHKDQKRKYTFEQYWTHPLDVASTIHEHYNIPGATEIALCHDLYEDTDCTNQDLIDKLLDIGYTRADTGYITKGVQELTDKYTKEDYPNLNRSERKSLEAIRLGKISYVAQTVKYADLIDNTKSIVSNDPKFAVVYLAEKEDILRLMRGGNSKLLKICEIELRIAKAENETSLIFKRFDEEQLKSNQIATVGEKMYSDMTIEDVEKAVTEVLNESEDSIAGRRVVLRRYCRGVDKAIDILMDSPCSDPRCDNCRQLEGFFEEAVRKSFKTS